MNKTTDKVTTMSTYSKLFQNVLAVFFGLILFSVGPVHAAYVKASSDMVVNNLGFDFGNNANAQVQWTDDWYGEVSAHAADSDSTPADDSNSILGNNAAIQAVAQTAHVYSEANYSVINGDQIGTDPGAGVTGTTHSNLHLERPNMQADGFAKSNFDNFFILTDKNDPSNQGPVNMLINMNYSGTIFGTADSQGFFVDITHFAALSLSDALSGTLLASDLFTDSISGTNTTITHNNSGTLQINGGTRQIPITLNYNTEYWLFGQADSEIYGYTVPEPHTLLLLLICIPALVFRLSGRRFTT
jgi:hypothetical protein